MAGLFSFVLDESWSCAVASCFINEQPPKLLLVNKIIC